MVYRTAFQCLCLMLLASVESSRDPNCPRSGPSDDALAFSSTPSKQRIACNRQTVELYCCVNGYSYMHWQFYDEQTKSWPPMYLDQRHYLSPKDKNQTLRLEDLNIRDDTTTYRCIAEDDDGNSIHGDIKLLVKDCSSYKGDPEFILPENEAIRRLPGQAVAMECRIFFGPDLENIPGASLNVSRTNEQNETSLWIYPDETPTDHVNISWMIDQWTISAKLYVYNISEEEYGNYTCLGGTTKWQGRRYIQLLKEDPAATDKSGRIEACSLGGLILIMVMGTIVYKRYQLDISLYIKDQYKVPPASNRDKLYDAFIVHNAENSDDRNFCIQTMLPILEEQHRYRIAVIERDAIPGGVHLESYDSLVSSSQCLVFILSQGLLECENSEYVFAQVIKQDYQNMIFIYREEIPESDFDEHKAPMLAAIKVAKNVLHWPDAENMTAKSEAVQKKKFWKQLRYALPARLNNMPDALPCPKYGHRVVDRTPLLAASEERVRMEVNCNNQAVVI